VLIPLDSRPACAEHPVKAARVAGREVRTPPAELLGDLLTPGNSEGVLAWLDEAALSADAVVVSADMVATGGLVPSRMPDTALATALARLERLREVRRRMSPGCPLYVFSIVQRIAPTALDAGSGAIAQDIANYVRILSQAEEEGRKDLKAQADAIRARVPDAALARYYEARQRNHAVNLQALQLVANGVIDALVLGRDDTALYGPHVAELRALRARVDALGIADRVMIYPGADEIAMTLVTREVVREARPVRVWSEVLPRSAAEDVQPYDDRPLRVSIEDSIVSSGCREARSPSGADLVFIVVARSGQEMTDEQVAEVTTAAAGEVDRWCRRGNSVAVADIIRVNISEPQLVARLAERKVLPRLAAYAGWGAASNTMGTALAQGVCRVVGDRLRGSDLASAQLAGQRFTFERLADDYLYLTQIRPPLAQRLGVDGYSSRLNGRTAEVADAVAQAMVSETPALFATTFADAAIDLYGLPARLRYRGIRARLPWPRMFEVAVDVDLSTLRGGKPGTATGLAQEPAS